MKYGPQTEEIEALIEKISNMPEKQAVELRAAWFAASGVARDVAHEAAWGVAWAAARNADRWSAREAVRDTVWFTARDAAHGVTRGRCLWSRQGRGSRPTCQRPDPS